MPPPCRRGYAPLWSRRKTVIVSSMKELDPHIRPCLACGGINAHLESMLPPGRRQEVWRVVCACGQTSQQWSVSQGAAIRAWNRNLAQENDLASLSKENVAPQSHLKS